MKNSLLLICTFSLLSTVVYAGCDRAEVGDYVPPGVDSTDDSGEDITGDTVEDTAEDTTDDADTSEDTSTDTSEDTAEDTSTDTSEDTAEDTSTDTSEDTAEDTVDDTDDGGTTPSGACDTPENTEAFESYAASTGSECQSPGSIAADYGTGDCNGTKCALRTCSEQEKQEIATCVANGVMADVGIDQACGDCYAALTICVIDKCGLTCADPTSADCESCRVEQGCDGNFETCAGIPVDYDPCQ